MWSQGDSFNVVQQYVIGTQLPALGDERHFALADGLRFPIEGSLVILAVRNSVRPNHLFDHNLDHDYYFELPVRGTMSAVSSTVCAHACLHSEVCAISLSLYASLSYLL